MKNIFKDLQDKKHNPSFGIKDLIKYIGPGMLVTVGFIDPGNWASNFAAGSEFGYNLLWVVTLSTIMLIVLQHNVAHLGIATGLCLSEAITQYFPRKKSRFVLYSAILASIATSLAEILGSAIALEMLFNIPIKIGAIISTITIILLLFTHTYTKIEKIIVAIVSFIGFSFVYELFLADVVWIEVAKNSFTPTIPEKSIFIIMSVLGAVVMPHNLFLHSEIIQSRQWNLEDEQTIKKQLKFEFFDTTFSMIIGWIINSAMIILAAATFYTNGIEVSELQQTQSLLEPLLGSNASTIFALALLMAGIASTITSAIAGGSIFAGVYSEPFDLKDNHSRLGVLISLGLALLIIFFVNNPFQGLIISQMLLSVQLPITIFSQIKLTSSKKVMKKYVNKKSTTIILYFIALIVTILNIYLFYSVAKEFLI